MPTHIVVNSLGLTYKGTIGISIATIPDVCKTPTPGGPVPLPYPNFANQGTLKGGTTTVFAKGGKMIAIKGSQYGMSTGDEPGTVGGVKSNTFKQATDWITYSFDVKMDGKNACRHTDKKFHNNKNTVNLQGDLDPQTISRLEKKIKCAIKECDRKHYDVSDQKKNKRCSVLGTLKHACVEKALKDEPKLYTEASFNMETRLPQGILQQNGNPVHPRAAKKVLRQILGRRRNARVQVKRPDACTGTGPTCNVYDAKFPCPEKVKSGEKLTGRLDSDMSRTGAEMMEPEQEQAYRRIAGKKGKVMAISPGECKDVDC
ncbi:DUF4150 domain-containing protein [Mesorhizobium sp.]|uniref:DUF4150 domain-containing protein n=1 Tax=Mesorhizobium sp. TaxID=1871066 RepID=UPI0025805FE0|nr:DUF4150 domain-containing protein [Mesorhizobium sp.]